MTKLETILKKQIIHSGPMSISNFMETCLLHPKYGYYTNSNPFGEKGDFITAPEISQMFGELIGLFLAQAWADQENNQTAHLVELGPGRGTLARDIMRATKSINTFPKKIYLIEVSDKLKSLQKTLLKGYEVEWIKNFNEIPKGPIIIIANEFFDSLPINQYIKGPQGWHEKMVGINNNSLIFGLSDSKKNNILSDQFFNTAEGSLVEIRATAEPLINQISDRISLDGGISLIIDYGDWETTGDTLQAVSKHQPIHPLTRPGEVDITAHVDFASLVQNVSNCSYTKLTNQGIFLERLGISERANVLYNMLTDRGQKEHLAAHRRLTHPEEMGTLFKVIALFPHDKSVPQGLEY